MNLFNRIPNVEKLKAKRDINGLIKALEFKSNLTEEEEIKCGAIRALGELGDKRAALPIIQQIPGCGSGRIMVEIAEALGKIRDIASMDQLVALLSLPGVKFEFARWGAIMSLGKTGHDKAIMPLIIELVDLDWKQIYLSQEAEKELLKFGDRSVPYLVKTLISRDSSLHRYIVHGRLKMAITRVLDKLGWKPETENEKIYYLFGRQDWKSIATFGDKGREVLNEALEIFKADDSGADTFHDIQSALLELQAKTGDFDSVVKQLDDPDEKIREQARRSILEKAEARSRSHLVEYLFRYPKRYFTAGASFGFDHEEYRFEDSEEYLSDVSFYSPVFIDFTEIILKLAGYKSFISDYDFHYPLEENLASLAQLCGIKSKVADNILHLVVNRADIQAYKSANEYGGLYPGVVSLDKLRKAAAEELQKRGNPNYDSSVFSSEENWKLSS